MEWFCLSENTLNPLWVGENPGSWLYSTALGIERGKRKAVYFHEHYEQINEFLFKDVEEAVS